MWETALFVIFSETLKRRADHDIGESFFASRNRTHRAEVIGRTAPSGPLFILFAEFFFARWPEVATFGLDGAALVSRYFVDLFEQGEMW